MMYLRNGVNCMQKSEDKVAIMGDVDRLKEDVAKPVGIRESNQKHLHVENLPKKGGTEFERVC